MPVFDASTLILLAKADLLVATVEEVECLITDIVARECTRKEELADAIAIKTMIEGGKIKVEDVKLETEVKTLRKAFRMGGGETTSVLLAKQRGLPLATDDKQAMKACRILRVPFLTAIHLLLFLHDNSCLSKEMALIRLGKLEKAGRYSSEIVEQTTKRVRERKS